MYLYLDTFLRIASKKTEFWDMNLQQHEKSQLHDKLTVARKIQNYNSDFISDNCEFIIRNFGFTTHNWKIVSHNFEKKNSDFMSCSSMFIYFSDLYFI